MDAVGGGGVGECQRADDNISDGDGREADYGDGETQQHSRGGENRSENESFVKICRKNRKLLIDCVAWASTLARGSCARHRGQGYLPMPHRETVAGELAVAASTSRSFRSRCWLR